MSFVVRDGKCDVILAAAPNVEVWPSVGVRTLATLCSDLGLTVGVYGGESLAVRGVLPLPSTGGIAMIQDSQNRVHRMEARAIVKVSPAIDFPTPFAGWETPGLLHIAAAERLMDTLQDSPAQNRAHWSPATVILGTGNRALRLGSRYLELGVPEVICVESYLQWGAKRYAGWEVERRRFEILGGKSIEASPVSLTPKSAMLWELRLQDFRGIRVIDVARVIAAGPFAPKSGTREYPHGSFLFEFEQTALEQRRDDVEGWRLEEERGNWLGSRIVKALVTDLASRREEREHIDAIYRSSRGRLKRFFRHREKPFAPAYEGKWFSSAHSKILKTFSGVPQQEHRKRPLASIECFEDMSCTICQKACPEDAIHFLRTSRTDEQSTPRILDEAKCTGCAKCVAVCPSGAVSLVQENDDRTFSSLLLPIRGPGQWKAGEFGTLVNRRGEPLGSARVGAVTQAQDPGEFSTVQLEVPTHLLWEARGIRSSKQAAGREESLFSSQYEGVPSVEKVEVTLDGEKRYVRDKVNVSVALVEIGRGRAGDSLLCKDGSCGLCYVSVDGVKKLGCQTRIRKGMAIKVGIESLTIEKDMLCPCLGIRLAQVEERVKHGKLHSPEAVLSVTHVGEGKCHGQLCMGAFRRALESWGMDTSGWIDWRFPWTDWIVSAGSNQA